MTPTMTKISAALKTCLRFETSPSDPLEVALLSNGSMRSDGWAQTMDELLAMRLLEDDWDGMGAQAPPIALVDSALTAAQIFRQNGLPVPCRVVAGVTGTVIFEWQIGGVYHELEVNGPGNAEWLRINPDNSTESCPVNW